MGFKEEEEEDEEEKEETILGSFQKFCTDTKLDGWQYLLLKNTIWKIIWAVLLLLAWYKFFY
jgi:hypothetical protein